MKLGQFLSVASFEMEINIIERAKGKILEDAPYIDIYQGKVYDFVSGKHQALFKDVIHFEIVEDEAALLIEIVSE